MGESKNILDDKREIAYIDMDDDSYIVGVDGVSKIEVYGQGAYHCDVPWFAIYIRDSSSEYSLYKRINGAYVSVVSYKEASDEKAKE